MLHELDPKDKRIPHLLAQDRIGNLTIKGELEVARPGEIRVFIDDPANPRGLLVTNYWVKLYAQDEGALAELLLAIADKPELRFGAVPARVRDYVARHWEITWENPCWLYYVEPGALREELIRHEIKPLRPEDAALVNECWEHHDEETIGYVRWRIETGPSCAIFEGESRSQRPVSWALTHGDGAMGMMFTLPEARRRGYGLSITVALAREILKRGKIPFLYTLHSNVPAQQMIEHVGFARWGDYRYFGARRRG
jgi:GNAT superfamily N-acetyltransferase